MSYKFKNSSNNESALLHYLYPQCKVKVIEDRKSKKLIYEFSCHSQGFVDMMKETCRKYREEGIFKLDLREYNLAKARLLKSLKTYQIAKEDKRKKCRIGQYF